MRVIGSGFGRTGTLSTKHALEELGFGRCYHMEEVMRHPTSHVPVWVDHVAGRDVDWAAHFAPYGSAVDFPASLLYRELMAVFPDAKVLHTVRDPDRWYDSTRETIYAARDLWPRWLRTAVPPIGRMAGFIDAMIWDGLFEGRFEDRAFAIERYERWTDDVVATVPNDRLLVFEVRDGWGHCATSSACSNRTARSPTSTTARRCCAGSPACAGRVARFPSPAAPPSPPARSGFDGPCAGGRDASARPRGGAPGTAGPGVGPAAGS